MFPNPTAEPIAARINEYLDVQVGLSCKILTAPKFISRAHYTTNFIFNKR